MNPKKRKAVELLSAAVRENENEAHASVKSLGELSKALSVTGDKAERKRLVKAFAESHREFDRLLNDTDLVNSEAERALIELAFGAESVTEEERTDNRGRKTYRRTVHRNAPNLNALLEWLRNKDPENWSPNPQAEPELEDTEEMEKEIYGEGKKQ